MEYSRAGSAYVVDRDGVSFPTTGRTGSYWAVFPSTGDRLAARYAERREDGEPLRILDIGCGGCGYHTLFEREAAEQLEAAGYNNPAVEVVGIDLNLLALHDVIEGTFPYRNVTDDGRFERDTGGTYGTYRMVEEERDRLQPVGGDAARLPFADDAFDMVYSCVALFHIPDEYMHDAVAEAERVLAEGGVDALERVGQRRLDRFRNGSTD